MATTGILCHCSICKKAIEAGQALCFAPFGAEWQQTGNE
jgi:hypothetical protein